MKKTFALLAALMLVVMMLPTTAMAYGAVTPTPTTVPYSLKLTLENATSLAYNIKYSFTAESATVVQPTGYNESQISQAVSGNPTLSPVEFTTSDTFTEKACTKSLTINWDGVEIKEPGVFAGR